MLASFHGQAQCLIGTLKIAGCACLSGCNLTTWGGPNCGAGNTTTCAYQFMQTTIAVPAGCTFRVEAYMDLWAGCPQSGADASPSPSDRMKVEGTTPKSFLTSAVNNNSLYDIVVQTGGNITIQAYVNRSDEIVWWTVTDLTSGGCTSCAIVLPIEIHKFEASYSTKNILLKWETLSEVNNSGFSLESSTDGLEFSQEKWVSGAGNSQMPVQYQAELDRPQSNTYYRLVQYDNEGNKVVVPTTLFVPASKAASWFLENSKDALILHGDYPEDVSVQVRNMMGQLIDSYQFIASGSALTLCYPGSGIYMLVVADHNSDIIYSTKFISP
jgi:hypothetical protein